MATWNPQIMRQCKRQIDVSLSKMGELNDNLLKKTLAFEAVVQDEVVVHAKAMIAEIRALVADIKEKAQIQIDKMEKAAEGISRLEASAADNIKGIR